MSQSSENTTYQAFLTELIEIPCPVEIHIS